MPDPTPDTASTSDYPNIPLGFPGYSYRCPHAATRTILLTPPQRQRLEEFADVGSVFLKDAADNSAFAAARGIVFELYFTCELFFQITIGKTHGIKVEGLRGFYHITTPPRWLTLPSQKIYIRGAIRYHSL